MKNKNNKIGVLVSIYFITFLFIGIAYSFLSENLELRGTVGFSEKYNYSYNYILQDSWNDGTYYYYYFIPTITYYGNDSVKSWKVNIKVPNNTEVIGCFEASECIITNDNLGIKNATWNGTMTNSSSATFGFQIKTTVPDYQLLITSVEFYTDIITNTNITEKVLGFNASLNLESYYENVSIYSLSITNNSKVNLKSWRVEIEVNSTSSRMKNNWGSNYVLKNKLLVLTGLSWNSTINIGQTIDNIGFQISNVSGLKIKSFTGITTDNKEVEMVL